MYRYTSTRYRYGCTGIQVRDTSTLYRYRCTGTYVQVGPTVHTKIGHNSTHKNWSRKYTHFGDQKYTLIWRQKIHNYSRPVNTRRGRVSTSTGGRNNCYVKVLPVPVPDTTSTRTCFWTLGATENIRERNYLKYGEVHRSIVPRYKLRTKKLGTTFVKYG